MRRLHPTIVLSALALIPSLLTACGSDDSASSGTVEAAEVAVATTATQASPAEAPALVPVASFALEEADQVHGVALSPDGSRIAVSTQERLGAPLTLRLYDASTGEVLATAAVDGIGLGKLHWMADGRLVSADREMRAAWRSWDGTTLRELPRVPQDATCADGQADKNTGAVYSSDGMVGMGDDLCRVDTTDGSIVRSASGALVGAERFWVRPAAGEVVVLHSPRPEESLELVTLDGASLRPTGATVVQFGENVEAVARTAWISRDGSARLEPGAMPAPNLSPIRPSGAGAYFVYSNGMDDFVFVSAVDGREIGTMPAGMNLSTFADWSIDDASFVRLTLDRQAEIYRF
jgi:hypothetical protein